MNNLKAIFFDFDGVIAESVHVKTEAFYQLYLPYGEEIASQVRQHHLDNGGMSRFEKFKLYHQKFLNISLEEAGIQQLAQQFSELVLDAVVKSTWVEGVVPFLEKYHSKLRFWVITGTPTEEAKIIVEKKGIAKYFQAIYGSPKKKDYWVAKLLKETGLKNDEIIFLGDATADHAAAISGNLHFALRETPDNKPLFADYTGIRFSNFMELEEKLFQSI